MTEEQVRNLKLGIAPIDERVILTVESGLEWVNHNTTLNIDMNNDEELKALPSCVRLFLTKFVDVQMLSVGVSSESIEGLSQSFGGSDTNSILWQFAQELLSPYLESRITFHTAKKRWG